MDRFTTSTKAERGNLREYPKADTFCLRNDLFRAMHYSILRIKKKKEMKLLNAGGK
jgi:hypothetical protein